MKDKDSIILEQVMQKIFEAPQVATATPSHHNLPLYFVAKRGKQFVDTLVEQGGWESAEKLAQDSNMSVEELYQKWIIDDDATPFEGSPIRIPMKQIGFDTDKIIVHSIVHGELTPSIKEIAFIRNEILAYIPTRGRTLDAFF